MTPQKTEDYKTNLSLILPASLKHKIIQISRERRITLSALIVEAVESFIDESKP